MRMILVCSTIGVCASVSFGLLAQQASFVFANNVSKPVSVKAPVYDWNGDLLWGTDWRVELYGGAAPNSLSPATAAFTADQRVIIPLTSPGYFQQVSGSEPTILGVTWAYLQVKVWDLQLGATYEQALARGQGGYGQSSVFYAAGGDETVLEPAWPLVGLTSFSVLQPVPEASTWALLALGLGGLLRLSMNKTHTRYRQRHTVTVLNGGGPVPGPAVRRGLQLSRTP